MTDGEGPRPTENERKSAQLMYDMGYKVGYGAGYLAAQREANESWRAAQGSKVFVAGEFAQTHTAAERKAERLEVIAAAHAAGVHGDGVYGCPDCTREKGVGLVVASEPATIIHGDGPICAPHICVCGHRDCKSQAHHNGDYGVRPGPACTCTRA